MASRRRPTRFSMPSQRAWERFSLFGGKRSSEGNGVPRLEGFDDSGDPFGHFLVGQGASLVLELQAVGEAAGPRGEPRAAVEVEEADILQVGAALFTDGFQHL